MQVETIWNEFLKYILDKEMVTNKNFLQITNICYHPIVQSTKLGGIINFIGLNENKSYNNKF